VVESGHEGHSFEAVEWVVADPFPPGTDPDAVRLPPVARLRSPEDNEENHLRYWQVHLWETLLRYRRAYRAPACPDGLLAGYDDVAGVALRLAERATSGFPLSPIDSVGCHSTLKELRSGALGLEATVAALADGSGAGPVPIGAARPTDFTAVMATAAIPTAPTAPAVAVVVDPVATEDGPSEPGSPEGPDGPVPAPLTQDLFAQPPSTRSFEFKLGRRTARGLRRGRNLDGDGEPPVEG
jgi:hypothetical protein